MKFEYIKIYKKSRLGPYVPLNGHFEGKILIFYIVSQNRLNAIKKNMKFDLNYKKI